MSPRNLAVLLLAGLFFGGVAPAQAQAPATFPVPNSGTCYNVDISYTETLPDNSTVAHKITLDCQSLFGLFWNINQHWTNASSIQNMKQYAMPACLVASGADGSVTFDRTANHLRDFNGALYTVSATGVPYKNAQRLGVTTNVQKLCLYGNDVLGKGQNDSKWYVWKDDKWQLLATGAIDATVLN